MEQLRYNGYLAPYADRIRLLHEHGASTREIAEALYALGVRAQTSDPLRTKGMSREAHIINLQAMTIHVQRRLGLRIRRVRTLNLRPTREGTTSGDQARPPEANSQQMIAESRAGNAGTFRADIRTDMGNQNRHRSRHGHDDGANLRAPFVRVHHCVGSQKLNGDDHNEQDT